MIHIVKQYALSLDDSLYGENTEGETQYKVEYDGLIRRSNKEDMKALQLTIDSFLKEYPQVVVAVFIPGKP